jgi:hypothetical protein
MSKSNYAEDKVNELLVGKTAFTLPSTWLALYTSDPTETGSAGTEVTGTGYARKATVGADWGASSGGVIANANALTFPQAGGSWGGGSPITHWALRDASTGGNMLIYGTVTTPKVVASGDTPSFAAGTLTHTED